MWFTHQSRGFRAIGAVAAAGVLALSVVTPSADAITQTRAAHGTPARSSKVDPSRGFNAKPFTVVTSTGHRVKLSFWGGWQDGTTNSQIQVSLDQGRREGHWWQFSPAGHASVGLTSQGSGTISLSSSATGGIAQINLHVRPDGAARRETCENGTVGHHRHVTIRGTFVFDTQSHGPHRWGTIGKPGKTFTFKHGASFDTLDACIATPIPCAKTGISGNFQWNNSTGLGSIGEYAAGPGSSYAAGWREVAVRHGLRNDYAYIPHQKKPSLFVATSGAATVKVHGPGGTGTIHTSKRSRSYTSKCHGQTYKTREWDKATYTSGKHPIKIPMQIFGNFVTHSRGQGFVELVTKAK